MGNQDRQHTKVDVQIELLKELLIRDEYAPFSNMLNGIHLEPFQTFSIAQALIVKEVILSWDTGLGKTLAASAVIKWYSKAEPSMKFLVVCKRGNYTDVVKKIKDSTGLNVVGCTAEDEKVTETFVKMGLEDKDVLVLTYEAIRNFKVNLALFRVRRFFKGIIVDESHLVGNDKSNTHKILKSMIKRAKFKMLLTATPLTISPRQVINQFEIICPDFFKDIDKDKYSNYFEIKNDEGKVIGYQHLDELERDLGIHYINFTRQQLGLKGEYDVKIVKCNPSVNIDLEKLTKNKRHILKTEQGGDAIEKLVRLCKDLASQGKKGIIYADLNELKSLCLKELKIAGLKVDIIDGSLSDTKERDKTKDKFNNNELDVLITNITEGLDLTCDFIIFYELTLKYKQMIGRGERGLRGQNLEIYFFIVKDTIDEEFFITNIYERGILLRELCKKDIGELEDAYRKL